jgi:LysR family transcriptional activator of nhaA
MMNYNHLYYFHVVATEGSVASAAQRLGVTQPTVSEQIQTLQRTLQVTLFDRIGGGLKLTDEGRLAYEQTSVMFRAGERLVESLGHDSNTLPRSLRVGLSSAVSRSTTSDFLMPLLALANCIPSIQSGDAVDLLRDLRTNGLDLVLAEAEPPESSRRGLDSAAIASIRLVAVAPPGADPGPDWRNLGLIHYRPASSLRWVVESFLEAKNLHPRIAGEADDPLFLVEAAARGGYVVIVPRSVARDAIKSGRLAVIAEVAPSDTGVYALYPDGESSELARSAVEVLIAHAATLDA